MCQPVPCETCHKTTWAGCGEHVDEVKAQVPDDQWCPGHPGDSGNTAGGLFSRFRGH